MSSGRVVDYLGEGLAASRPITLDLHPGTIGFWRSTDTEELSVWSDNAWHDASAGGGGIPDAPIDGSTYGRKDGGWEVVGSGGSAEVIPVNTPSNTSGTVTLDFGGKSRYVGAITLGANVTTLAFSGLPASGNFAEYELHIKQDGTGNRTFAIPASHKALGGSDTAIASAANSVTVLSASTVDDGGTWRYAMQESA